MATDPNNFMHINTQEEPLPPPIAAPPKEAPKKKRAMFIIAGICAAAAVVGIAAYMFFLQPAKIQSSLHTYFTYEQKDIDALRALSSAATINIAEVQKWEDKAYGLVESHESIDVDASKVYAYLSVGQMDAAALSLKAHQSFVGNIGLVSKDILCEFYADSCSDLQTTNDDAYSKKLSEIVLSRVKARIAQDNAQTKPATLKTGSQYWSGPAPQIGLSAPSFKPWLIASADQFRAAPPDATAATLQKELAEVKKQLASAANDEKAIVIKWAGGPGTRTPPGIWLTLANDYMQGHATPLDKSLEVRSTLAMSMADAVIAVFDSKYTYQVKRPNMVDPSIVSIMPTPNHPSYPAGHATISWAAATVLTAYLPDNKQEWERLAKEASDSRTIGGIHFPMDNAAGTTLGSRVGAEVLKKWQE